MKFPLKLLAAISSAVLLTGAVLPLAAAKAAFPAISDGLIAETAEDAAVIMREYLKARSSDFTVTIEKSDRINTDVLTVNDIVHMMMYKAFDETGNGSEGDYLRFSVKNYKCAFKSKSSVYELDFHVDYYTTPEEEAMLEDEIKMALSSLSLGQKNDYEKIRAIYEYVTKRVKYSSDIRDPYVYSAYNALINGNAVCQGITQLLYKMYIDSGISCRIIAGISHDLSGAQEDVNHVWLIVGINGTYYLLDPTWDLRYKGNYFMYFLKGSDDFDSVNPNIVHIARNDVGVSFPDYDSEGFKAAYPISKYVYTPPSYSLGDINGDKRIDSVDASMILAEYASISGNGSSDFNAEQTTFADVNSDGYIDAVDASVILRYYAFVSNGTDISLSDFMAAQH